LIYWFILICSNKLLNVCACYALLFIFCVYCQQPADKWGSPFASMGTKLLLAWLSDIVRLSENNVLNALYIAPNTLETINSNC